MKRLRDYNAEIIEVSLREQLMELSTESLLEYGKMAERVYDKELARRLTADVEV